MLPLWFGKIVNVLCIETSYKIAMRLFIKRYAEYDEQIRDLHAFKKETILPYLTVSRRSQILRSLCIEYKLLPVTVRTDTHLSFYRNFYQLNNSALN